MKSKKMLDKDQTSLIEFVAEDNKQKDKKKQEELELFAARNNNDDTCKGLERENAIVRTKIDKDKDLLKLAHDY